MKQNISVVEHVSYRYTLLYHDLYIICSSSNCPLTPLSLPGSSRKGSMYDSDWKIHPFLRSSMDGLFSDKFFLAKGYLHSCS